MGELVLVVKLIALVAGSFIFLLALSLWFSVTDACVDPKGRYAVEVVLNKPGVLIDLNTLEQLVTQGWAIRLNNSVFLLKYTFSLSYPSTQDEGNLGAGRVENELLEFLVTIYEAKFLGGVPYVEGFGDPSEVEYYPGVRLELFSPPNVPESVLEENINIVVKVFLSEALRVGLLRGLTDEDVNSIGFTARLGYAGWNDRMIYHEQLGGWAPYSELVVSGLVQGVLLRENACSVETFISMDALDAVGGMESVFKAGLTINVPLDFTTTTPNDESTLSHLLIVAYSVMIGLVAGLVAYFYASGRWLWR